MASSTHVKFYTSPGTYLVSASSASKVDPKITDYIGRLGQLGNPIELGDYRITRSPQIESLMSGLAGHGHLFTGILAAYYCACSLDKSRVLMYPKRWRQVAAFLRAMGTFNRGEKYLAEFLLSWMGRFKGTNLLPDLAIRSGFKCPTFQTNPVREWKTRDILRLLHLKVNSTSTSPMEQVHQYLLGKEGEKLPDNTPREFVLLNSLQDPSTPAGLVAKLLQRFPGITWENVHSRTRFNLDVYSSLLAVRGIHSYRLILDLPRLQDKGMFKDELFVTQIARVLGEESIQTMDAVQYLVASLTPGLPKEISIALQSVDQLLPMKNLSDTSVIIEPPMSMRTVQKAAALAGLLYGQGAKEILVGNKAFTVKESAGDFGEYVNLLSKALDNPYKPTKVKGKVIYLSSELRPRRSTGAQSICITIPKGVHVPVNQPPSHLDVVGLDKRVFSLIDYWLGKQ